MDAIQTLAEIVAQDGPVRSAHYASNATFGKLVENGYVEECGIVQSVFCNECDQPHDAEIVFEAGAYGFFCPDLGFISKIRSDLVTFQPNLTQLVEDLAERMNCKRRKSTPVHGPTWRIGLMPKSATLSSIKSLHTYTISEAAGITGVSVRTVREWIKQGLSAMTDERPTLVRGDALIEFIKGQRSSRKKRVPQDAFFCLKCRLPRKPAGGFVDCCIKGNRVKLIGICETCETIMHKAVSLGRLPEIEEHFDISLTDVAENDKKSFGGKGGMNRHLGGGHMPP